MMLLLLPPSTPEICLVDDVIHNWDRNEAGEEKITMPGTTVLQYHRQIRVIQAGSAYPELGRCEGEQDA